MRVALVHDSVDPRRGGAETSLLEMAHELQNCGARVTLVFPQPRSMPPDVSANAPEKTFEWAPIQISGTSKLARTRSFFANATKFLRTADFDVVHALSPIDGADVYQPRGGTFRETIRRTDRSIEQPVARVVKSVMRKLNRRQQFLLKAEEKMLCRPEGPVIACVSEYVRRQVIDVNPRLADRACVVFNGVATSTATELERSLLLKNLLQRLQPGANGQQSGPFQTNALFEILKPENSAASAPRLLFVAHNFRLKGLGPLLRAVAQVKKPSFLLVAGNGRSAAYMRLSKRLGIRDRVFFLGGKIPIRELFAISTMLCHPTWYDPCSRVVLEALQFGLPVVTSKWNGASERVRPTIDGFVIDEPDDTGALANAIDGIAAGDFGPTHHARMENLSMNRHARELMALYSRIRERVQGSSGKVQ